MATPPGAFDPTPNPLRRASISFSQFLGQIWKHGDTKVTGQERPHPYPSRHDFPQGVPSMSQLSLNHTRTVSAHQHTQQYSYTCARYTPLDSGPNMPRNANSTDGHLDIKLDSDVIIVREMDGESQTVLSGEVVLKLTERADVKDISLVFSGRCKTYFTEQVAPYKAHSMDEETYRHGIMFLPSFDDNMVHSHTLKAGVHSFPFTFPIPVTLPSSLRTSTASGLVEYRLKATAIRPGFTSHNWTAKRPIYIHHGLRPDAVEYSSSLDIENDWPGKVSYAFTIPYKAHAIGAEVPCHIKFVPHNKGVVITSLQTTVREHIVLHSKYNSGNASRDLATVKHYFIENGGVTTVPPSRLASTADLTGLLHVDGTSDQISPGRSPDRPSPTNEHPVPASELERRLANMNLQRFDSAQGAPASSGSGSGSASIGGHGPSDQVDEDTWEDDESHTIHTILKITVPPNATPSHSRAPVVVSHRIKWSALIRNPDGHTSELRCALPILILPACLGEEARLASSGARHLLFGPTGALLPVTDEVAQTDLPSYPNHVHDRVAIESLGYFPSFAPSSWATSVLSSPSGTPYASPSPSRPSSPSNSNASSGALSAMFLTSPIQETPLHQRLARAEQHASTDSLTSVSPGHIDSGPSSSFSSRRNSRVHHASSSSRPDTPSSDLGTSPSSSSFFNLHFPKPLRPFATIHATPSRSASSSSHLPPTAPSEGPSSSIEATPRPGLVSLPSDATDTASLMAQVPPYEVATDSRTGVVPISSSRDLPSYEASSNPSSRVSTPLFTLEA